MDKPEALRLADALMETHPYPLDIKNAAAELRRLRQFAEDQIGRATAAEAALQMTKATHALKIAAVETQRDALLEALKAMLEQFNYHTISGIVHDESAAIDRARAAICACNP